jgi:hypothetical protein
VQDPDAGGLAVQLRRDRLDVALAGGVVVGKQDNVAALEVAAKALRPLPACFAIGITAAVR